MLQSWKHIIKVIEEMRDVLRCFYIPKHESPFYCNIELDLLAQNEVSVNIDRLHVNGGTAQKLSLC